jgi:hypothetical protein
VGLTTRPCSPPVQWRAAPDTHVGSFPHLSKAARLIDLVCREDLNTLVKRHIQTVVTSTPNRALNMLEADAAELIAAGMVTLNAKLMGVQDIKLIARVVETWNFFWDQVLTYVEGVSNRLIFSMFID